MKRFRGNSQAKWNQTLESHQGHDWDIWPFPAADKNTTLGCWETVEVQQQWPYQPEQQVQQSVNFLTGGLQCSRSKSRWIRCFVNNLIGGQIYHIYHGIRRKHAHTPPMPELGEGLLCRLHSPGLQQHPQTCAGFCPHGFIPFFHLFRCVFFLT